MTEAPEISIIMANHNKACYIEEAIRSVLRQTFRKWELIIVDDASTDDSVKLVRKYLHDTRIRLIERHKREGHVKATIYGLTEVRASIVGILDSDDALTPQAIEKSHALHTKQPELGLVLSQKIKCDSFLKQLEVTFQPESFAAEPLLWMRGTTHFRTFKLAAYNRTAGLDPTYKIGHDWDLVFKLEEVAPTARIEEPLYLYRQLDSSVSRGQDRSERGYRFTALALYRAYLRRKHTNLPNIPLAALLGWLTMAVRYSSELNEPRSALLYALRCLRVAPWDGASWRAFITIFKGARLARCDRESKGGNFSFLRSYAVRELQSKTGNIEPDRVVCLPLVHREGHFLFGGDTLILESGRYCANFRIKLKPYMFAESPLVILDIYENLTTNAVLAERTIDASDLNSGATQFSVYFSAVEGQRVEFRAYWREQCFIISTGLILQKERRSESYLDLKRRV